MAKTALLSKVGQRVRSLRRERALSQEKLAFKAECGVASIGRIERGELNATLGLIDDIATALHVPALALFDFDNTPDRETASSALKKKAEKLVRSADRMSTELISRVMDVVIDYQRKR